MRADGDVCHDSKTLCTDDSFILEQHTHRHTYTKDKKTKQKFVECSYNKGKRNDCNAKYIYLKDRYLMLTLKNKR